MKKFRKKPVIVEAVRFNFENRDEIIKFLGCWYRDTTCSKYTISFIDFNGDFRTLKYFDYVAKRVNGECEHLDQERFEKEYEEVKE